MKITLSIEELDKLVRGGYIKIFRPDSVLGEDGNIHDQDIEIWVEPDNPEYGTEERVAEGRATTVGCGK